MHTGWRRRSWIVAGLVVLVGLAPGCDRRRTAETPEDISQREGQTMSGFDLQSGAFGPNEQIPGKYTGDGKDVSPALRWSGVPEGTKELALIMDDPDAPTPKPWVHWVLYRIPGDTAGLPEAITPAGDVPSVGAVQGKNTWNKIGYGGPAPPPGHGRHRYYFKLYALDTELSLGPGATKEELLAAMEGHVLAQTELVGTYQR